MSEEKMISAKDAVDHLLLGVSDLDQGVAWVEKMTGVRPLIGGVHPGRGTRNALASLGGRQYLEVMAPDPAQEGVPLPYDLRSLTSPRLVHWAAATDDIERVAKIALAAGMKVFGPNEGARARPDGRMLKWKLLDVQARMGEIRFSPIPFFIQWAADSQHPSQDSPEGLELRSFEIESPEADIEVKTLRALGVKADMKQTGEPLLRARLKTPKGEIELS
jgi:hypothetical protein